jgi:hypothetical protein
MLLKPESNHITCFFEGVENFLSINLDLYAHLVFLNHQAKDWCHMAHQYK